jgi:hypothetical protein
VKTTQLLANTTRAEALHQIYVDAADGHRRLRGWSATSACADGSTRCSPSVTIRSIGRSWTGCCARGRRAWCPIQTDGAVGVNTPPWYTWPAADAL